MRAGGRSSDGTRGAAPAGRNPPLAERLRAAGAALVGPVRRLIARHLPAPAAPARLDQLAAETEAFLRHVVWLRRRLAAPPASGRPTPSPARAARIRCHLCGTRFPTSWGVVRQALFESSPLHCISCGTPLDILTLVSRPEELDEILRYLDGVPAAAAAPAGRPLRASPGTL